MGTEHIIGLVLALLIMAVGLIGSVVPGLPGPPLVLLAAIGHRLYFGAQSAGNLALATLVLLMLLAILLDYLSTLVGARKFGATWRGVVGAALGAMVGLLGGPLGLLSGPFIGAALLEMAGGRELHDAGKAGLGALLGLLLGGVAKIACCVAMIGLFTVSVALNT
jgi:uncharacterized protein YqgC (DUF456 family)